MFQFNLFTNKWYYLGRFYSCLNFLTVHLNIDLLNSTLQEKLKDVFLVASKKREMKSATLIFFYLKRDNGEMTINFCTKGSRIDFIKFAVLKKI